MGFRFMITKSYLGVSYYVTSSLGQVLSGQMDSGIFSSVSQSMRIKGPLGPEDQIIFRTLIWDGSHELTLGLLIKDSWDDPFYNLIGYR